jgi:hypothetical protein
MASSGTALLFSQLYSTYKKLDIGMTPFDIDIKFHIDGHPFNQLSIPVGGVVSSLLLMRSEHEADNSQPYSAKVNNSLPHRSCWRDL